MKHLTILLAAIVLGFTLSAQNNQYSENDIPSVYHNIKINENGTMVFVNPDTDQEAPLAEKEDKYTLNDMRNAFSGTEKGLRLEMKNKLNGTLYYGLFADDAAKFPQPIFFRKPAKIVDGIAEMNIAQLKGKYDIANWEEKGVAKIGYRIVTKNGEIIYDGKIYATGKGPFEPALSIVEGPFVNKLSPKGATISFTTNYPSSPFVKINGKKYSAPQLMGNMKGDIRHEILIDDLEANKKYEYTVVFGEIEETYSFTTAPKNGSRKEFIFAFASDSRAGVGGGERNIHGSNIYIMKKFAAYALAQGSAFMQFTGDMINGYNPNIPDQNLQYANWKRGHESYWHYIPFNVGPGNHEVLVNVFDDGSKYGVSVDKFPFGTSSSERLFANNFVNPENGPLSEDGSKYDPDKSKTDFPAYKEGAYFYTYDNVAMIVMNSNYLYTASHSNIPLIGGNVHGYIMDNQLEWLEKTIKVLNKDKNIDHIFVSIHTPAFPNGGHSGDDMWYGGNNEVRPYIDGKPVEKGMLERRDEFLDIIVNKSEKTVALLTGDEHNYSRMLIDNNTQMYPEGYKGKKLKFKRSLWQMVDGSAGAPYYGQEELPWSNSVEMFSTQYALMLFKINGENIELKVVNPDTFDVIEEVKLR